MLKDDRFHFGLSVQALFQRTFLTVTVCFPLVVSGAVKTWDGSTSGYWGTGANWTDGVAPSDGDDLVFPAGAAHLLNTNNILRLKVGSITFSGSNYIIRGLPIGLANGIAGKQASGGNTLELDVTLQADQTFDCRVAGAGQTLSGNITNAGYVLTIAGSGDTLLSGVISGAGGLTKNGSGTCRLAGSAANTYTGTTTVNAGTLELNKTAGVAVPGRLVIGDGSGTDMVRELAHYQIGFVSVTVNSSGRLDLNGFNDSIGPLTLSGGTVTTGTGTLYMMGDATVNTNADSRAVITGIVSLPATRTIDVADSPEFLEDLTIAAEVRGSGGLIKTGPGRLYLTTSNSFSGPVTVQTGCLWVQNSFGLGATNSGTVVQAGANLSIQNGLCIVGEALTLNGDGEACGAGAALYASVGSNVWTGPVTLASDSWIAVDATGHLNLSGPIGGPGGLRYWGSPMAGSLILSGSAANTYGGTTYVIHGTLVLNKAVANGAIPGDLIIGDGLGGTNADVVRAIGGAQIGNSGNVVVNSSGLLDLSAMTWEETLGSLAGSGNVALGSNHLSVNINNASTVFSGVISGAGGRLTKLGTGMLTLAGNNTYSGSTTVGDGTLLVNGSQPASAVTLSSSTGKLGGSGTVGGVTANGIVAPGASPGVLTVNGNLAFSASGKFGVELNGASPGTGYDQLNVVGTVSLGNAALQATLGFVSPGNTSFTIINNDAADAVVGTFAGLPQGAILHISGTPFRISYTGGDGNDVVLTQLADTQQPLLQIAPTGGTHVVLWWPTNFSDYKLVSNTNLESGEWSIVSTPPVVIGTNYHVTNQATRPQLYYRLQFP